MHIERDIVLPFLSFGLSVRLSSADIVSKQSRGVVLAFEPHRRQKNPTGTH